jgi:hypothetical protein
MDDKSLTPADREHSVASRASARASRAAQPTAPTETPNVLATAVTEVIPADVKGVPRPESPTEPALPLDPRSMPWSSPPLDRLGPYKVIKAIGRGGMGTVYLAEDTGLIGKWP